MSAVLTILSLIVIACVVFGTLYAIHKLIRGLRVAYVNNDVASMCITTAVGVLFAYILAMALGLSLSAVGKILFSLNII